MSKYGGLCETCNKAETCIYQRDPNQPVLQCEEFDGYEPKTMKELTSRQPELKSKHVGSRGGEKDSDQYLGLCSNCENRHSCTYPKQDGGVWHCEDYR
ncbi:hypothetical protein ACFL4G_03765 [Thermodesulfobacteriota bacterium]